MNKIALLAAVGVSGLAIAPASIAQAQYAWARVLDVEPITRVVRTETPMRECRTEEVTRNGSGANPTGAMLAGALIGGVVGNQIGSGSGRRVATAAGDFFRDRLPRADVITMGMILHDWNLEKKKMLIAKAYRALPEGGALVAIENLIDDDRRHNAFGLMMSLNMLIEFGDAFDYTGADFAGWCLEAGFRRIEVLPLQGPASAAIAYK